MSNYSINSVSRGVNNFFESLTNSSNPTYIQPINTYTPSPPSQTYITPPQIFTHNPLPIVTYTPKCLRTSFVPLNSNYSNAYYGK
jgi:hypothetical protein